jgi:hypothetical protein
MLKMDIVPRYAEITTQTYNTAARKNTNTSTNSTNKKQNKIFIQKETTNK